ncbi:MAG: hypothetical protein WD226_09755 [Planctomycetota bacterium]
MIQLPGLSSLCLVLAFGASAVGALGGCTVPPRPVSNEPPGKRTEVLAAEGLERLQPADIAVAPIENLTGVEGLPSEAVRAALAEALVQRLYTPLALDYVDAHWVDASFRGSAAPDATLLIKILGWNDSGLTSKGELAAEVELKLVEGGTADGRVLWGRRMQRVVDVASGGRRPAGLWRDLFPAAARALATEFMTELPERNLASAPREAGLLAR